MGNPDVKSAIAHNNYLLTVTFETGEIKKIDMMPYLKYEVFGPLKNIEEFKKIFIDFGTVCWECGAELSNDTFYIKGQNLVMD